MFTIKKIFFCYKKLIKTYPTEMLLVDKTHIPSKHILAQSQQRNSITGHDICSKPAIKKPQQC